MPNRQYPHIFLRDNEQVENFSPPRGGGKKNIPPRERLPHSNKLKDQWAAIWAKARAQDVARSAVSMPTKGGAYIEFEGAPNFDLVTKSLEDRHADIRLLSVYKIYPETAPEQEIVRATVFVPSGKEELFLNKIRKYAEEKTKSGNPKNARLIQSVEAIRLAVLESFWRDDQALIPNNNESAWCEIWLREGTERIDQGFRELASKLGIEVKQRLLRFPERTVVLALVNRQQLEELIETSSYLAEIRRAKETAGFFLELENKDQTEWVKDLLSRLRINPNPDVSICVLDTGANNGHALLSPVLSNDDCHAVESSWGITDHDRHGHGTLMCGLAAYGDLQDALQHSNPVEVRHCLASAKILPPNGQNDPELYGDITIQGISRAEIQAPQRSHIGCMAVTSTDDRDRGRPSSWSAAIDQITFGADNNNKRLFIVCGGNIEKQDEWAAYPGSNQTNSIHDPGQSWNALTVGAFTGKYQLTNPDLAEHQPLAQPGELSPFSTTSLTWESKWPAKPDIVLEGGNLAKAPNGFISAHDDLSLLSTGSQPTRRQFDSINATSAAAAQAAWMAAQIQVEYPQAWPESIRGLMVHTAEWPDAMKRQLLGDVKRRDYKKDDYGKLLRYCGYGVPNLSRALKCASNSLTLIAQAQIQPYDKKNGHTNGVAKEMHVHRLPWPSDLLLNLGELPVSVRITLSYFIEPGPGEIGWKDRYRYPSYALRFDLNAPRENEENFRQRLNVAARDEGERPDSDSGRERWTIGANSRNVGSVHSDIWNGTAAEIATCNLIGVYPVGGWWKERTWLERWNQEARYSLIVSILTPEESVDIYTPVAIQLGIPVEV